MVRVITVHHFASQHIQTVEQPTACTIAPPQRILLALTNHSVEVRDLNAEGDLLFTFPTVDHVIKLIHSQNGDYVATLETKSDRQNRETNYVRVYVNWDSIATLQQSKMTNSGASLDSSECGMVQPMRARIAGRVTPTTNQSELGSLEMIEIPVRNNPSNIVCCQVSGNLLIQSDNILTIHAFQIKTHDISKLKFVDFGELPIYIEISFIPLEIAFCENYIACLNKDSMHTFRIIWKLNNREEDSEEEQCDTNFKSFQEEATIDYKELLKNEKTNLFKGKVTVNLPSVIKGNSIIHKHSPFTCVDKDMSATIHYNFSMEDKSHHYEVIHLLQLKLKPIIIEPAQTPIIEEFKCLLLRPLYVENNTKADDSTCPKLLKSNFRNYLSDVVCIITTLQEGYVFQFCDSDMDTNVDNCISMYPFTSPVLNIALEGHLLHALTDSGLETYTVRIGHKLFRNLEVIDDQSVTCPPIEDLICLIGLRPFIGVEQILLTDNYLVLLANADNSPTHSVGSSSSSNLSLWTLYNLELPTPKTIFNDIAIVANVHRFTSPQTYCHLMSEANMILRLYLMVIQWSLIEGNVRTITLAKHNLDDVIDTYRTSCALLGDHFIMTSNENDYILSVPYYKMAGIASYEVLKRFKKVKEESHLDHMMGILYYLKMVLSGTKVRSEVDTQFKIAWKKNFIEEILTVFENHNFCELPNLILKNFMLREFSTTKFINILSQQTFNDPIKETEKYLALAVLYVQECNIEQAEAMLKYINNNSNLQQLLLENFEILFEFSTATTNKRKIGSFSEFSIILMYTNGDILSDIFVKLILDKKVSLHKVLKMFLTYLPLRASSPDGTIATTIMQKTLEGYFKNYFINYEIRDLCKFATEHPSSPHEAMKILVRSYLSQLQILQVKESLQSNAETNLNDPTLLQQNADEENSEIEQSKYNQICKTQFSNNILPQQCEEYLFANFRHKYLDKMPPFEVEITSKLYEMCIENYVIKEKISSNEEADLILRKLQALFCCQVVSKQVISEANTLLTLNETLRGYSSLKSVLMGPEEAVAFLIDACPQCLLQYGKDCFKKNEEWRFLINNLQKRIIKLSVDPNLIRVCFFHKKLLKDVLVHLSTSIHVENLEQMLPERNGTYSSTEDEILDEIYSYENYITMCKETMHANQIKKLITTTGQQLLCTLNL